MYENRGILVVFEGVDRSGKTTQSKILYDSLVNIFECGVLPDGQLHNNNSVLNKLHRKSELWSYPNRITPVGKLLDAYLTGKTEVDDRATHLLFSANRWERDNESRQILNCGNNLIIDRLCVFLHY